MVGSIPSKYRASCSAKCSKHDPTGNMEEILAQLEQPLGPEATADSQQSDEEQHFARTPQQVCCLALDVDGVHCCDIWCDGRASSHSWLPLVCAREMASVCQLAGCCPKLQDFCS